MHLNWLTKVLSATTIQLPGLAMSIAATPERVRSAIGWLFQVCPRTDAQPDLSVEAIGVSAEQVDDHLPSWVRDGFTIDPSTTLPVMISGPDSDSAAIGSFDGLLFCAWEESINRKIKLVCGIRNGAPTRSIIPSVLFPVLRDVLLKRELLLLHSAAVRSPDGRGLLFIAVSGGGKTTTNLAMVRRGAKLVSDDLVVVDLHSNTAQAGGIPKPLNLREGTISFFNELRNLAAASDRSPGRVSVSPQAVYGNGCLLASCPIDVLYFLEFSKGLPSARRLGLSEGLSRLIHSHMFASMQNTRGDSILSLCELLGRTNAYQLKTGDCPEGLGEWLLDNSLRHATEPNSSPS